MPQSDRSPPAVAPTGPIGYRARPALTICIPAYRATPFLDRTLNALRRQTFRDFQVILSNDGGHDAPEIDRLCADPGIRVIHQTARLGWVRNKTRLVALASSPYFAILPHDDEPAPTYYATLVGTLQDNPGASAAYSDISLAGLEDREGVRIAAKAHTGTLRQRIMDVITDDYPGVSIRAVNRTPPCWRALALQPNPMGDLFVDSTWIMQQAVLGPMIAVPRPLYRKHYHGANTHTEWKKTPDANVAAAWMTHCVHLTALGLGHLSDPADQQGIREAGETRCLTHRPAPVPRWISRACMRHWEETPAPALRRGFQSRVTQRLEVLRHRGPLPAVKDSAS